MTREEFEKEWFHVMRATSDGSSDWYSHVSKNIHLLSTEACTFIVESGCNIFGEWLIKAAYPYTATQILEDAMLSYDQA